MRGSDKRNPKTNIQNPLTTSEFSVTSSKRIHKSDTKSKFSGEPHVAARVCFPLMTETSPSWHQSTFKRALQRPAKAPPHWSPLSLGPLARQQVLHLLHRPPHAAVSTPVHAAPQTLHSSLERRCLCSRDEWVRASFGCLQLDDSTERDFNFEVKTLLAKQSWDEIYHKTEEGSRCFRQ